MQILNVKDVLAMDDGLVISGVKGKVKSVFDQSKGNNEHGDWSLQNATIVDLDDPSQTIKLKLSGRDPLEKALTGKIIYLTSTKTEKHGLQGIKVTLDTYKGKTSKLLKITGTAEISFVAPGESQEAPPAAPAQKTPTQKPAAQPSTQTQQLPPDVEPIPALTPEQIKAAAVKGARQFLGRRANLMLLCLKAADYVYAEYGQAHEDEKMSIEQYQSITSSLYISADRAGIGDNLPTGSLEAKE